MKKGQRSWVLVMALAMPVPSLADTQPLSQLLDNMQDGPMVRAAEAEQRQLESERRQRRDERGWSVFGGVDTGYYRELEFTDETVDYTGYGVQLGIRYPLLGTLRARTQALVEADSAVNQQQQTRRLQRAEQRLALREAYIDWWEAHQVNELCRELRPLMEQELRQVRDRIEGQGLRQSERMLLEQRWSTRMRSCRDNEREEAVLRSRVSRIAGQPLAADARPQAVPLAEEPAALPQWSALVREHPLIVSRRSDLEQASELRDDRWYHNVESSFTLSQRLDWRDDVSGTGLGLVGGVTFEMPIASGFSGAARAGESRHTAARERLDGTLDQLRDELEGALQRYRRALDETHGQIGQVALIRRIESERAARERVDTEAGFMALRTSRVDRADAAFDLIRAWRNTWAEQAQLYLIAESDRDVDRLLGRQGIPWPGFFVEEAVTPVEIEARAEPAEETWDQSAYVWNSAPLLDPERRSQELAELADAGFGRIYLGLDADQVARVEALGPEIRRLVSDAGEKGMAVDLLLGEPSWIEPEHRGDLLELIQRMRGLPFDRLHLDLEVEQLGWPVPDDRVEYWIETVKEAQAVSSWPVTLVSHHRWFAPEPETDICVPCRLEDEGVDQISLMIYITQPERLVRMTRDIAEAWPELRFRIAQSVEPELDETNSWKGRPKSELSELADKWREALEDYGVMGLEWQDWASYPRNGEGE